MHSALITDTPASGWDRSLYAFLAEKQQRSGSMRTVNAYANMLRDFFGRAGKTPDAVGPQEVFAWAYGIGLSGKQPSPTTINARIACLSSYYRFLMRMQLVTSKSLRAAGTPSAAPAHGPRAERRAGTAAPRMRARHPGRTPGPRHHPHAGPYRTAKGRGARS